MQVRSVLKILALTCMLVDLPFDNFSGQACAADGAAPAEPVQMRINALIEQLGDKSFIKREAAKEELERMGLIAFESLRSAEMHANVEIAQSATYLLESMQVDWSLPTDSFEVQRTLKDYNAQSQRNKLDVLQRLANLERADAFIALMRLMRYEKDEKISKAAGLHVMESAIDALTSRTNQDREASKAAQLPWKQIMTGGATETARVTAAWLQSLADQFDLPKVNEAVWQKHVTQERMLLESNARGRTQTRTKTDDETVKRLYRVVAKLMVAKNQKTEALDFFEPCFDLVPKEPKEAFNDLQWMIEAGLPHAVVRLNEQRPELFATRTRNRYLLAEAYLKNNELEQANKTAKEASDLASPPADIARRMGQAFPGDPEAAQRHTNFDYLSQRGLYDWSEAELKRILSRADKKGEVSIQQELTTRQRLALFYWSADQPDLAADAWKPIMLKAGMLDEVSPEQMKKEPINKELKTELMQRNSEDVPYIKYIPAHYYFYLGLAAGKKEDWALAREHLRKAVAQDASDPDVLIAMYHATKNDVPFKQLTDQLIDDLESNFRLNLEKAESELAMARSARPSYENVVAMECNQLAWLLSCTERKVSDAVMLSQRACNLMPESGVYIDTLARCYFAAGKIDKAIELQTKAIKLVPYERSMQRQLEEFRAAKK